MEFFSIGLYQFTGNSVLDNFEIVFSVSILLNVFPQFNMWHFVDGIS